MKSQQTSSSSNSSRRSFLRKSALGIMGISLAASSYPPFPNRSNKVVVIRHRKIFGPDGHAGEKPVLEMVNRGITELTGTSSPARAWRHFFTLEDVIGLKINAVSFRGLANTPLATHYPVLTRAIMDSCADAGLEEKQFLIWDRSDAELVNLGYALSNDPEKLKIFGTSRQKGRADGIGFHPEQHPVGKKTSRVSRILSDITTAMINVPVIKPHTLSGITVSLKNHYGSVDNPSGYHLKACTDPGIPEINAIPVIRQKERLVICNALQAMYKGGIHWKPANAWPYGGIILGTDPVAVDRVCLKILNEKRIQMGKRTIENRARHIRLSAELGIGVADLEKIEHIEIELA